MGYLVETRTVAPVEVAAVRRRVRVGEVATAWRPALDQVWEFLRRHEGLRTDGHNVIVYRRAAADGWIDAEFGVQVTRSFDGEGDVVCTATPAGPVAATLHVGPYDKLGEAYDAIRAWAGQHGRLLGTDVWEVYGDWSDDPALLETQLFHRLAPTADTT